MWSSLNVTRLSVSIDDPVYTPSTVSNDDPSVSTPHAMVQINPSRGFVVQDLMSEYGVHVCRRGSSDFVREDEPVAVEHGDVLRIGEIEFVVSLIAEVGVK